MGLDLEACYAATEDVSCEVDGGEGCRGTIVFGGEEKELSVGESGGGPCRHRRCLL